MNPFENVSSTVGRLLAPLTLAPAQSPPPPTGFTLDNNTPTGGACVNAPPAPTTYSNNSGTASRSGQTTWTWDYKAANRQSYPYPH